VKGLFRVLPVRDAIFGTILVLSVVKKKKKKKKTGEEYGKKFPERKKSNMDFH